jgi:hypothetical protein
MSTEDLQTIKGIGAKTAEQLIQAGIPTPIALATCNVQKLIAIGIPKAKAMGYINLARERCGSIFGFVSGEELIQQFKRRQFLTTGTKGLDRILGGKGFETQKVYEKAAERAQERLLDLLVPPAEPSSAAPEMTRSRSAHVRASSSTTGPRDVLTR